MDTTTVSASDVQAVKYNGQDVQKLIIDGETAWSSGPSVEALENAATTRDLSVFTWAQLDQIGEDLSINSSGSKYYAAAVECAKAGAYRTTTYDGKTVYATLIGVNQCDASNGDKLGLTFMVSGGVTSSSALMGTDNSITGFYVNSSSTNSGGWGASAMRSSYLGSSTSYISSKFASDLKAVVKNRHVPYQPTYSATTTYTISYTDDFMWLLSFEEIYGDATANDNFINAWYGLSGSRPWLKDEGKQFLWFKDKGMYGNSSSDKNFMANIGGDRYRWLRSCSPRDKNVFIAVQSNDGSPSHAAAGGTIYYTFPCFCVGQGSFNAKPVLEDALDEGNFDNVDWNTLSAVSAAVAKADDEELVELAKDCVGMYKTTTYNGATCYATLIGINQCVDSNSNTLGMTWMVSVGICTTEKLLSDNINAVMKQINSSNTNSGGWGASDMRTSLIGISTGSVASLFPDDLKGVVKLRHTPYGPTYNSTSASVSYSDDFMWLLSYHELYGLIDSSYSSTYDMTTYKYLANEGEQFMWFSNNGVSASDYSKLSIGTYITMFLRSCSPNRVECFGLMEGLGYPSQKYASNSARCVPCFCI